MPTFNPPTVDEGPAGTDRLFARYKLTRGITVLKVAGHYVNHRYPTQDDLTGLTDGTDYFLGGHTYSIDSATATALTADGYGSYIT